MASVSNVIPFRFQLVCALYGHHTDGSAGPFHLSITTALSEWKGWVQDVLLVDFQDSGFRAGSQRVHRGPEVRLLAGAGSFCLVANQRWK